MRSISLFTEDLAHESFLRSLLRRLELEYGLPVHLTPRSVRGGRGKALTELRQYLRDIQSGSEALPHLLVVATDANCLGYVERRREADMVIADYPVPTGCAIPDPHIERWLLLDSGAFKRVLGKGCFAPDQKCEKDRYKRLLAEAVMNAGITPLVGGIEYAEGLVGAMDLDHACRMDPSFGHLLRDLRAAFNAWSAE